MSGSLLKSVIGSMISVILVAGLYLFSNMLMLATKKYAITTGFKILSEWILLLFVIVLITFIILFTVFFIVTSITKRR